MSVWLTPLLILSLAALLNVWSTGTVRQAIARTGEVQLPPDFQYMPPEQQAQIMKAIEATSGPVFLFVFPALTQLAQVWFGWLIVSGLVHFVLTLIGGRGELAASANLVAWAALPFAIRDLVRAWFISEAGRLLEAPGLSGFTPAGAIGLAGFLGAFLSLVDLYLIWHLILLTIGGQAFSKLPARKVFFALAGILLLVLGLQAAVLFGLRQFGGLTVIRPFF